MGFLRVIVASVLALGLLAAWRLGYAQSCAALAAPAALAIVLVITLREAAVMRRRCLAACYFNEGTFLRRLFSGVVWPTLTSLGLALVLAIALMLDVATWDETTLIVLAADVVLLIVILRLVEAAARGSASAKARPVVVKSVSAALNALALLAAIVALRFYSPPPAYADPSLFTMMERAAASFQSSCGTIDVAIQLQMSKEALGWWLALTSDGLVADGGGFSAVVRWAMWGLFLVGGAVSAFAYSRYMAEVLHRAGHLEEADGRDS